ncbi:MAG: endonuclease MutS2 [Bacteroidales bacterium]|nr:endonuclease MutS2 [Bacteroidales bacterium]
MIYPHNFEQKIEFGQIRTLLKQECISSLGESMVDKLRFTDRKELIRLWQEQAEEFRQILLFDTPFPAHDYYDLRASCAALEVEGSFLEVEELCELRTDLNNIASACKYFFSRSDNGKYPHLTELSRQLAFNPDLIYQINHIIDEKGNIRDHASETLLSIRRNMHALEAEISKNIKKILLQSKQEGTVDDNADVTIRNGRMVLPVPAVHKRHIKGFIHDQSASGLTYYIEPQEVFEASNMLHNLQLDEKREIIKILTGFADMLRPQTDYLLSCFKYLALLDFIRAKAKFAIKLQACMPIINDMPMVDLKQARHPLLEISLQHQHKNIVPVDIHIGHTYRILIISGPNAGGKSVCLKTLAMLQYMFQCGIPIPASPMSECGIFNSLFINIGDEQSIDNDLSTYSSQLYNIKTLLQKANEQSLFLLDELGSGTDPQYGGAIAETLIEEMIKKGSIGLVTTHFGNLKTLADNHQEVENGAMLYNTEKMQPTFQLQTGHAGTSFTFEIAQQIGLNRHFIQKAKQKAGKSRIKYDTLLHTLEEKQAELAQREKLMDFTDKQLADLIAQYTRQQQDLKEKRHELIHAAKTEAKNILDNSNRLIERTIKEIRETNAEKATVKKLREELKQESEKIDKIQEPPTAPPVATAPPAAEKEPVRLHDTVIITQTQTIGEVVAIEDDYVVVEFNSVQVRTALNKVEKVSKSMAKKAAKRLNANIYNTVNEKAAHFNLQLDIRGYRAEEAILAIEHYLDDAMLLSIHEVNILHGKGNGILRQVVREYLHAHPCVQHFHDAHVEAGGTGITIVKLL